MICVYCGNEYAGLETGGTCPTCGRTPSRARLFCEAESGSIEAMYLCALHYLGDGGEDARAIAADFLCRAAKGGCREAALTYARALLDGSLGVIDPAGAKALVAPYARRLPAAMLLSARAGLFTRPEEPVPTPQADRGREVLRLAAEAEEALDYETAVALLRRAGERGCAEAAERLGELYETGRMVAADRAEARRWYLAAWEAGAPSALVRLGDGLRSGRITGKPEPDAAFACYRRAAEAGSVDAALRLGDMAFDGLGKRFSIEEALGWYRSVEEKSDYARERIAQIKGALEEQYRAAVAMQDAGEPAAAAAEYTRLVAMGHAEAANRLGYLAQNGIGRARDRRMAAKLYEYGALHGSRLAIYNLGVCYAEGIGVAFHYRRAEALLLRARGAGIPAADAALASLAARRRRAQLRRIVSAAEAIYRRGDFRLSARLLLAAAEAGDPDAAFRISCRYRYGDGTHLSAAMADEWESRAYAKGFTDRKRVYLGYLRARREHELAGRI